MVQMREMIWSVALRSFDSPQHKYHTKIKSHPDGWLFIKEQMKEDKEG